MTVKKLIKFVKIKELKPAQLKRIIERNQQNLSTISDSVQKILTDIKENGDKSLLKYERLFDKVIFTSKKLKVTDRDISKAYARTSPPVVRAIEKAAKRIERVHKKQIPREKILDSVKGVKVKQIFKPINTVGVYIPGGKAPYVSTALMTVIPAKIAGVRKIIACSPPSEKGEINSAILIALKRAGVNEIYRVGGAQAIGAMTYGTETIQKVDKIVGPGNIYVTAAKKLVYGEVGIDFPAGPSEILIYANKSADSKIVAIDLIAQAEHDPNSVAILLTTSENFASKVNRSIRRLIEVEDRKTIISSALAKNCILAVANDEKAAVDFINSFAPEHLAVFGKDLHWVKRTINNAGSVSVGEYTPVAATDYAVGSNHVLPTGGSARFSSGLTVCDFLKAITVQSLTKEGIKKLARTIVTLSEAEGLHAHARSVKARLS
ncbi:MAG: histidinol dehydrogenase [Candidatus Bathyarchaeota archaeon]